MQASPSVESVEKELWREPKENFKWKSDEKPSKSMKKTREENWETTKNILTP